MKLSIAATILAGLFAVAPAAGVASCGSDYEIDLVDGYTELKFEGYSVTSMKRFENMGAPRIVLKDFGAVPDHSMDAGGIITVMAGSACQVNGTMEEAPTSAALSVFGVSSYLMGYPMISAAAILSANFLPVAYAAEAGCAPNVTVEIYTDTMDVMIMKPPAATNVCEGAKPKSGFDNFPCDDIYTLVKDAIADIPQAGGNVTKGYEGLMNTTQTPLTIPYYQAGLCPVNVHWHLGAEHLSIGEYDESGTGPHSDHSDRLLSGEVRLGNQCNFYNKDDAKFTTPYKWEHCKDMEVGETYEVHWPHSSFGACGTPDQFQEPFYDGVFCHIGTRYDTTKDLSHQVGVQAQVFTIVNDDDYYYPNMMQGMIVDGEFGADIAAYTGSTTGTTRNNTVCSKYSPITWQVDRKCNMISASSFDKMCADMKAQRDDMSEDLYAHGAREVVASEFAADNMVDYDAPP